MRTKSVLNPKRSLQDMSLDEADLAGPIMFALALASVLILHGKLAFGAIYGAFLMGCFAVYIVMSLLSQKKEIGFFPVVSIMGYGLLPIIVLATLAIIVSMPLSSTLAVASVRGALGGRSGRCRDRTRPLQV